MLIHQFFDYHSQRNPEQACLLFQGQTLSYAAIAAESLRIANGLRTQGIASNDRVAILCENCPEVLAIVIACSRIEAVAVPLNYRLAAPEVAYILNDAKAKILFAPDMALVDLLGKLRPLADAALPVIAASADGVENWQHWLSKCASTPVLGDDISADAGILQLYTSGTTGKPKGVVTSQRNIFALYTSASTSLKNKAGPGTRDLVCAPNFHIGGIGTLLLPILAGATVVLHASFNPMAVVDDLENHKIDNMFIVPAMIMAILDYVPNVEQRDFGSLRQLLYGASPISTGLLERALKIFKCDFYQCYGMTETTGTIVSLSPEDHSRALNGQPELLQSCGRPQAGVEVKVVDTSGNTLACGETGELLVRSEANMLRYYNREAATAETLQDGWIHTGDSAIIDEHGYIFLRDRIKDMIVSGGENIYPIEIENVLSQHPAVGDVAVVGVPCAKFGEAPLACIVLKPEQSLSEQEMVDFCREQLAGYKIPRQLKIFEVLPRNPSGKLLKKDLRAPFWADHERGIN
ncbi:acyl-CoA synthetase (AMP-forming)/AMP-acid ligase II [Zhongshania antarctica]|uniref:Acyl-CoA synthetase (AMP-forming)/AMP-acid ligase II n=1 Tax=Zhongshania antarctica TaxID=641702 RepID=A0A840R037_9GAMM|nr:long-chain-fatty-acid--CoA ligase [Zhongshania antarctica]MBB5185926.1 acyl-CoA synthetase (AMP-forming)/AMP-acid ligase II [Zhongshania antarctica]